MKTAELFALSCELSACLSGTPVRQRKALRQFGLAFGTAYQIYDDCLDVFGSEAVAGKSLGTDLAKGKLTLPVLLLWERAGAAERAQIQELIQNWDPQTFPAILEMLCRYESLAGSLEIMQRYLGQARQALAGLPESANLAGLLGLTEF